MGPEAKKIENQIYQATVVTIGAVGVSMAGRKILREPLGTPESMMGTLRLAIAVSTSSILVGWLQDKKYLPENPFK